MLNNTNGDPAASVQSQDAATQAAYDRAVRLLNARAKRQVRDLAVLDPAAYTAYTTYWRGY